MNILKNVGEYINIHLFGYRYDYEIIKYFNDPYRKAILTLNKEGYPVNEEFDKLLDDYQDIYHHLNPEELSFWLKNSKNINTNIDILEKIELRREIAHVNTCLLAQDAKFKKVAFEYKSQNNLLSMKSEILSKEIQKINPVYNAVLIRKLIKLIEAKLIHNYYNFFGVENYTPKIDLLIKYRERFNQYIFDKKNKIILTKINNEILELKKQNSNQIKEEKNKPKVVYLVNNTITTIHKVLNDIRVYCNKIIYFDPNKEVEFNIDESLFEKVNIHELSNNTKKFNKIYFENKKNKSSDKNFFIDMSKAANYIAFSNISNQLLNKLTSLKMNSKNKLNQLKNY